MTARAPDILIADDWDDYRLLDSGNGGKLEQVGSYRFVRPEPQALWAPALAAEWDNADAIFAPGASDDDEAGRWRFNRELPQSWKLRWDDIAFVSRPTPFRPAGTAGKCCGIFPGARASDRTMSDGSSPTSSPRRRA